MEYINIKFVYDMIPVNIKHWMRRKNNRVLFDVCLTM